jgi:hypothetical protein
MPRQAREPTVPAQRAPQQADQAAERAHLMTIALGLLDARVSRVDFFDTVGGREVTRMYRQLQLHRRATHEPKKTPKAM